jgi:hypothetical protein
MRAGVHNLVLLMTIMSPKIGTCEQISVNRPIQNFMKICSAFSSFYMKTDGAGHAKASANISAICPCKRVTNVYMLVKCRPVSIFMRPFQEVHKMKPDSK